MPDYELQAADHYEQFTDDPTPERDIEGDADAWRDEQRIEAAFGPNNVIAGPGSLHPGPA